MRLVLLVGLVLAPVVKPHATPTQVWEKRLAPGVVYRMEWDRNTPRMIHALRISLKGGLHPIAELGGHTVFENNQSKGRATVTEMVKDDGALAGVNGDFFPFTGDPLGLMVRDGQILSLPYQLKGSPTARRAAFGWGTSGSTCGFGRTEITVETDEARIAVEGLNEESSPDRATLDTPACGLAWAKAPNAYAIIRTGDVKWSPTCRIEGTITSVGTDLISRPVEPGSAILVGAGPLRAAVSGLSKGEKVRISISSTGFDWDGIQNVIGGGPMLLSAGKPFVDWENERMAKSFSENRHPRTAVGRTASGDIWLVAVDGRTKLSVGATLLELASIMRRLGCVDAMNLDGGGSTTFNLMGQTMNRPSDGVERPVANGIVLLGPKPAPYQAPLALPTISKPISPAETVVLAVHFSRDPKKQVPNSEVFWSASGSAWIDQGGTLHLRGAGRVDVTAFVRGQVLKATYQTSGGAVEGSPGFNADD